jgi:amino acid transporter
MSSQMPSTQGVFTRKSSGLVRQVGVGDVVFFGWGGIALGFIIFTIAAWQFYPGASMEWATVLATIGGLALGVVYALLSAVYPRSGGEYVFLSRILHPVVGFAASVSFTFWQAFYFGIVSAFVAIFGLSPLFATLALQTGNTTLADLSAWFVSSWGMFLTGAVLIVVVAAFVYSGLGRYFRIQRWGMWAVAVSLVVTLLVLLIAALGGLNFKSNFDALAGAGSYAKIAAAGAAGSAPFDLGQTIQFMIWPAFSIWFGVVSVSLSGEIKNVQRGQLVGIAVAMLTMGAATVALMFFSRAVFGGDFLIGTAAAQAAGQYPLQAPAYINVFAGIAGGSVILTIIMSVWVIGTMIFDVGVGLIYPTRAILAWSIDGLVPSRLADVSERYHSPTWAILVATVVAIGSLAIFAFTTLLSVISGFVGLALTFGIVAFGGLVFPYVKRQVFDSSAVAFRVGGIPVISILGAIALAFSVYIFYRCFVDSSFGANQPFSIAVSFIVVGASVVWFYAARWYRTREGVDLDARFREIPVE